MENISVSERFLEKISEVRKYWGERMPMMACEECAELIQAISKDERKPSAFTKHMVVEDIRDVIISSFAMMDRLNISIEELNESITWELNTDKES